jgi:hypothetical protein
MEPQLLHLSHESRVVSPVSKKIIKVCVLVYGYVGGRKKRPTD